MKLATLAKKAKLVVYVPGDPSINGFKIYRYVVGGWIDYYLIWSDCPKQIPHYMAPVRFGPWLDFARQILGAQINVEGEAC